METYEILSSDEAYLVNGGSEATEDLLEVIGYYLKKIVRHMPDTPPNMGRL